MKKIILISILLMSLIGCDFKNTKIELPDGLAWGMTTSEVDKLGLINFRKYEKPNPQNYTIYSYSSISYKDFDFSALVFDSHDELLTINFNNNYYDRIDSSDKNSDPNGHKAISLYNSYILKFDSLYKEKESKGSIPIPEDDFWKKQVSCDKQLCTLASKKYVDKDNTEYTVKLAYIKLDNEIKGAVGISLKRDK